jgi:hypothetical protein
MCDDMTTAEWDAIQDAVLREIARRVAGEDVLVVLENGETVRVRRPPEFKIQP